MCCIMRRNRSLSTLLTLSKVLRLAQSKVHIITVLPPELYNINVFSIKNLGAYLCAICKPQSSVTVLSAPQCLETIY